MPNTHETLGSLFTDIAESIRGKTGSSEAIVADNFPSAIDAIITDPTGDATATAADILSPKTAYSKGSKLTGTIATKTASDLTASDDTVTVPAGYYATEVSKAVDGGSATTPATTITTNPTVSWDSTNKKIKANYSGSQSVTPTVSAGYVASGTAGTVSTEGTTSVTAESLDENLIASNVRDGATIFNTTGTFSDSSTITGTGKTAASAANILADKAAFLDGAQINGTMPNNGATGTTITSQGGTYSIPAGYTSGGTVTANITATTLDNSIISGQAVEEASGDYAWESTVDIPVGYHNAQTLKKTFSEIFPAPETPATATEMLLGYQAYNKSGVLMTGTMANNGAVSKTLSTQGEEYTVPAGYHDGTGKVTASINNGVITSGAGSATISDPSYNSTSGKFDQSASGTVAAPSVGTAGYVSSTAGTKNTNTISGSKSLNKIVGSTSITGTKTTTPSIARQTFTISGVIDAASGAATTTAPSSGVYVKVKSAANTGTLTATPSVTTEGYGTSSYHGIEGNTATVGASASADTYVPITSGSATTPATTKAQSTPSISVGSDGLITASVAATSVSVTPTVSAGYVTAGTAGTVTMSASSNTKQLTTQAAKTVTPSTSAQTAVAAGVYTTGAITVAAMPSGSAGTPVATKGTVSNNSISVTPSATSSTGYITGSTVSGTAVTVSASELVSGNKSLSSSTSAQTGIDVTNYSTVSISAIATGSAGTPTASKGTVSSNSITVTPSVTNTTGYITGGTKTGTAVTVSASELVSGTLTLTAGTSASTGNNCVNYASVTVNPTPSQSKTATANGTITPDSGYLLSSVVVSIPTYSDLS